MGGSTKILVKSRSQAKAVFSRKASDYSVGGSFVAHVGIAWVGECFASTSIRPADDLLSDVLHNVQVLLADRMLIYPRVVLSSNMVFCSESPYSRDDPRCGVEEVIVGISVKLSHLRVVEIP